MWIPEHSLAGPEQGAPADGGRHWQQQGQDIENVSLDHIDWQCRPSRSMGDGWLTIETETWDRLGIPVFGSPSLGLVCAYGYECRTRSVIPDNEKTLVSKVSIPPRDSLLLHDHNVNETQKVATIIR